MLRSIFAVCLTAFAVACSSGEDLESPGQAELSLPLERDIRTLDPGNADSAEVLTRNILRQLYEGLVEYDPLTFDVVPRVASSWEVSPDGTRWVFQLHRGVRFIDDDCFPGGSGREVTAHDVKYSLERAIGTMTRGFPGLELPSLVGLTEFLHGEQEIAGLHVSSELELEIRLEHPDPTLLHFLARPASFIVAREAVERYGDAFRIHPVGTGPFRLIYWKPATGVYLVRNGDYWGAAPELDGLRFVRVDHLAQQYHLYHRRVVDVFFSYDIRPDGQPALATGGYSPRLADLQHHFVTWLNTIYVQFNFDSDHPLIRDPRGRQALSDALPRQLPVVHLPARGLFPPDLPGHDPSLVGQAYELDQARGLLTGDTFGSYRPLRMAAPRGGSGSVISLRGALEEIGVPVDTQIVSHEEFRRLVDSGELDLYRRGWIAQYPDPQDFLQLFYSGSPLNNSGYSNPDFDDLFELLRQELDQAERHELARAMERILISDGAAMFHRHERVIQFVAPHVRNWKESCTNSMNICFYERISLEGERPS